MNVSLSVCLSPSETQAAQLRRLQAAVADVCNELVPKVQANRCWNRVALHHMYYREMRGLFPEVGSQMICNSIYAVSRAYRAVMQPSKVTDKNSGEGKVPKIFFSPSSPVFFDRHTLSIRQGHFSLYTLDGRVRFDADLDGRSYALFQDHKAHEIMLVEAAQGFELRISLRPDNVAAAPATAAPQDIQRFVGPTASENHSRSSVANRAVA